MWGSDQTQTMGKNRGTYAQNADIIRKYAAAYLPARTEAASEYKLRQAYEPSLGGMASIKEASQFLRENDAIRYREET